MKPRVHHTLWLTAVAFILGVGCSEAYHHTPAVSAQANGDQIIIAVAPNSPEFTVYQNYGAPIDLNATGPDGAALFHPVAAHDGPITTTFPAQGHTIELYVDNYN